MKFPKDHPLPVEFEWRFWRQWIADETGWTLADVDAMSYQDYADFMNYRDAKAKATPLQKSPTMPRRARRRR